MAFVGSSRSGAGSRRAAARRAGVSSGLGAAPGPRVTERAGGATFATRFERTGTLEAGRFFSLLPAIGRALVLLDVARAPRSVVAEKPERFTIVTDERITTDLAD